MAKAFSHFASERPRPCHISIPIDVQAMPVDEIWEPVPLPPRPAYQPDSIAKAAQLLSHAKNPLIMVGGGAVNAAEDIRAIVACLGAIVTTSTAGKGIVPDDHPLSLSAGVVTKDGHDVIASADVVLAVGTELAETDSFAGPLHIPGQIIRIDLDPQKLNDQHPIKYWHSI